MKNVIAVIDDGISEITIPNLEFRKKVYRKKIVDDDTVIDDFSHGSICASIIKKYAPNARFGSIRILNKTGRGSIKKLIEAIKWCIKNAVKIIHLSIGTTQACDIPGLYNIVNEATEKGCIFIAACKNYSNVSFPASFRNVIGVRADETLTGMEYKINELPNGGIEFSAGSEHSLFSNSNELDYLSPFSNSYAAPVITAHVYNILFNESSNIRFNYKDVRKKLYENVNKTALGLQYQTDLLKHFENLGYTEKIPFVCFIGKESNTLMRYIADRFLQDNYLPIIFSDHVYNSNYEYFEINDIDLMKNAFYSMAEYYNADLVLTNIEEKNKMDIKPYVLITGESDFIIINCNSMKKSIKIKYDNHVEIYNELLRLLEQ